MGLKDYTPKTRTLKLDDLEISVRALSFVDIMDLANRNEKDIRLAFDAFVQGGVVKDIANITDLKSAIEIVSVFPHIIADIIAVASGEPDEAHMARLLPIGFQLEILGATFDLTVEAEGGGKKLMDLIVQLANDLVLETKTPLVSTA